MKDKTINKIRFIFSVGLSFFIYLPIYLHGISRFVDDSIIEVLGGMFICFIFAFLPAFFFLYYPRCLKKLISENTPIWKIFLFELSGTSFMGSLLLGIPVILGSLSTGKPLWPIFVIGGAVLGFIFGLIISIVIVILKKRVD